jgi:hypothetical protein
LISNWPRKHTEKHGIFTNNVCVFRNGMDSPYSYGIGCARLEVLSTNHREGGAR